MKERVLSTCEKKFILDGLQESKRLDGREFDEFRDLELHFGADYGNCLLSLGETKVYSQVSFEIEEPKKSKPNEGLLFVNVDISSMAAPHFEAGRQNNLSVRISRFLEKGIKDSNCVDLEALCIVADDKVWVLRIDLTVVNYDGNLFSSCSMAALASLLDTRLPQVKLEDDNIVIYSTKEKSPLPLSLNHFPVAVAFAIYHSGKVAIADPTDLEDRVKESELVYYINSFRELCGVHYGGKPISFKKLLFKCARKASFMAEKFVAIIKSAANDSTKKRDELLSKVPGIVDCINVDRILAASQDRTSIKVNFDKIDIKESGSEGEEGDEKKVSNEMMKAGIFPPKGKWKPPRRGAVWSREEEEEGENVDSDDSSEEDDYTDEEGDDVELVKTITEKDRIIDNIELGDSEEEETVEVKAEDLE